MGVCFGLVLKSLMIFYFFLVFNPHWHCPSQIVIQTLFIHPPGWGPLVRYFLGLHLPIWKVGPLGWLSSVVPFRYGKAPLLVSLPLFKTIFYTAARGI